MSNEKLLSNKQVAIIATNGFEQSELLSPKQALSEKGADIHVISIDGNKTITGWDDNNWGDNVSVDKQIEDVVPEDYDAVVLPGGQINPDVLRTNNKVVGFIKKAATTENVKAIAAICHGPWLLAEAGLADGKELTSFPSITTDIINAGGSWKDESVVCDGKLITSRNPNDLDNFNQAIIAKIAS